MRSKFDEQLELLNTELIQMGALCETAIALAAKALAQGDMELAGKVPETSLEIYQKGRNIETLCMKLLLQQQPVATDLRIISSALRMITDMERIGNNSGDIAEIVSVAKITEFNNPNADGEKTLDLLMIAKYFERMGDHAVGIARWVIFSITGNKE